jgi:hypothetical protein
MTKVVWDDTGNRRFETGVDQGVLYPLNPSTQLYDTGFAWNGLTMVKEQPTGAASNPQYADNIKYMTLLSTELYGGTIEAFTYPEEFGACDGTVTPVDGVVIGQQARQMFGLSYRSKIGNDVSPDLGFKLHLVYGAIAAPAERDYATVNASPGPVQFSWVFETYGVPMANMKPVSLIEIDSTEVDSTALSNLMDFLYGTSGSAPSLPMPDAVLALFSGSVNMITLTAPTFDGAHTITIPSETGVTYYVDGVVHTAGSQLLTSGQKKVVTAIPSNGYVFNKPFVAEWLFTFVS